MIDDQFDRLQWIDQSGIASQGLHGVAHGRQIDYAGDAGEILEKHTAGAEGDFPVGLRFAIPVGEGAHFFLGDGATVFGAELILEQDAQREG